MGNDYIGAAMFLDKMARREHKATDGHDLTPEARLHHLGNARDFRLGRDAVAFIGSSHELKEAFASFQRVTWTVGDEAAES